MSSSNRTFMELKFKSRIDLQDSMGGSNRTFMELKYSHSCIVIKTQIMF